MVLILLYSFILLMTFFLYKTCVPHLKLARALRGCEMRKAQEDNRYICLNCRYQYHSSCIKVGCDCVCKELRSATREIRFRSPGITRQDGGTRQEPAERSTPRSSPLNENRQSAGFAPTLVSPKRSWRSSRGSLHGSSGRSLPRTVLADFYQARDSSMGRVHRRSL